MPLSELRTLVPGLDADLVVGTLGPDFNVELAWQTGQGPATVKLHDGTKLASWVPAGLARVGDALFVWEQSEWGEPSRVNRTGNLLVIDDDGMTLRLTVADLPVQSVRREGFWPEKLPYLGEKLPDYPVRLRHWPLVCAESERLAPERDGRVGWRVHFAGGMTLEHRWAQSDLEDLSLHTSAHLGVWPPKIIPRWRLYSVLMQAFRQDYQPQFWLGKKGEWPGRASQQSELRSNLEQGWVGLSVEGDVAAGVGPRFVVMHAGAGGERCGVFELLKEDYSANQDDHVIVALDFGTSNTVAACTQSDAQLGQRGKAIELDRHLTGSGNDATELLRPLAVTSGASWTLEQPWVPGVFAPEFENPRQGIDQIPSGIFLREARGTGQTPKLDTGSLPFVHYTFVGPGLAIERSPVNSRSCWISGLKWSDTPLWTEKFLEALLTWLVAVCRGASLRVRASYPLAFPSYRRKAYAELLSKVTLRVAATTGAGVSLDTPYHAPLQPASPESLPFVDESSPLILNQYQRFELSDHQGERLDPKLLLVADLGGGTLDVLLGYFFDARTHRVLATESVRIGARDVLNLLMRRLEWPPDYATPEMRHTLLEGWARRGTLVESIRNSSDHGRRFSDGYDTLRVEWAGLARVSANEFRQDVLMYFFFLCEYVARFFAGVLTQPQLIERVVKAPGETELQPEALRALFSGVPGSGFALSIVLTGNGWGFLDLVDGGEERWCGAVVDRIKELTKPRELRVVKPNRSILPGAARKLFTAERVAELSRDGHPVAGGVEVAPNGFADRSDGAVHPWGALVGRDADHALPAVQVIVPTDPELAPPTFGWFRTVERQVYNLAWLTRARTLTNEGLENIRAAQNAEAAGGGYRLLSTQRAFWEIVVRRALGLPPL
jgi:hypothetical protein